VDAISTGGAFLYFSQGTTVYRRLEGPPDIEPVTEVNGTEVLLAGTDGGVFVGSNAAAGDDSTQYQLAFIDHTLDQTTPEQAPGRLLALAARYEDVYFLVEHAETRELRVTSRDESSSRLLAADANDVVALAPGDGFVFASFEQPHAQGIRAYAPGLSTEWHTRGPALSLTSDASGELWFFDARERALVRAAPFAGEWPHGLQE
jgi:hypothetical protein